MTAQPTAGDEHNTLRAPERRRLYEQIEQLLLAHITSGGLTAGDRLPSERDIATILKVSRVSLRQATLSLEVKGVLEVRHGGGIYVRSASPDPDRLKELLLRRRRLPDVLEAREALECKLARLAARRRTDADLDTIDQALAAMELDITAGGTGDVADGQFHDAIAAAAKNALLHDIMVALGEAINETRLESLSQPGRPRKSLQAHRRIAEAIRDRHEAKAEAAMRRHLKVVADTWLLRWQPEAPLIPSAPDR